MKEAPTSFDLRNRGDKKQLRRIALLAMTVAVVAISVVTLLQADESEAKDLPLESGSEFTLDGLKYRVTSTDPYEAQIIGYESISKTLTVPDRISYLNIEISVTSIGKEAFYACTTLVHADLGNVSEIGVKAFANCTKLRSVEAGDSLKTISAYAFYRCTRLADVDFDDSVKTLRAMGSYSFYKCPNLSSIPVPSYVSTIGGNAFSLDFVDSEWVDLECTADSLKGYLYINEDGKMVRQEGPELGKSYDHGKLCYRVISTLPAELAVTGYNDEFRNVSIPDSLEFDGYNFNVTTIADGAFKGYVKIRTVSMPCIEKIGKEAFYGCTYIKPTDLDSITSIGIKAFSKCTSMKDVSFGDSLKKIGAYAFYACKSLSYVDIPDSTTSIGSYAFYKCNALENADLGDSLKKIGSRAFAKTSLENVEIPSKVTSIGEYAFYDCSGLLNVDIRGDAVNIGSNAFASCIAMKHISMPETIKKLGSKAFNGITFYDDHGTVLEHSAKNLSGRIFDGSGGILYMETGSGGETTVSPNVSSIEYDSSESTNLGITTDKYFGLRVCRYNITDSKGVIQLHGSATSSTNFFTIDTAVATLGYLEDGSYNMYFDNRTVPYAFDIVKVTFNGNGTAMKSQSVHLSTDSLSTYAMPAGFIWNTERDGSGAWVSNLSSADFVNYSATLFAFQADHFPTANEMKALEQAKNYVKYLGISENKLKEYLIDDDYSDYEAFFAVINCGADWDEEALEDAREYVDALGISAERLKEFLLDNGFTESQAIYGVANCGADWDAEALEYARSLLEYSSYSESDLLESLLDEGFTDSQSRRAVESVFQ